MARGSIIIVPILISASICTYAFWRFLKRVESPVVDAIHDVQKMMNSSQVLLENINQAVLKARETVDHVENTIHKIDHTIDTAEHAIQNMDQAIDEIQEPLQQTLAVAEDAIQNIDSAVSMVQLKPFTSRIKKTFLHCFCFKYKETVPKV